MLEINTIKTLDNNKVLLEEKNTNNPKAQSRYYITKEDKVDEFIKGRNSANISNGFQKILSAGLSVASGFYAATLIKASTTIKALGGVAVTAGVLLGCTKADKFLDKHIQKSHLERYEAEEITHDKEKLDAALNYEAPTTEEK